MENVQAILDHLEQEHWWYQARREIVATVIDSIVVTNNPSIVSVGCGNGTELQFLQSKGRVIGLDIDAQVVAHCKEKGFEVIQADLLNNSLTEQFDVVIAMDIVEHIKDDKKAIQALYDLLKPGGSVIITVPAFPFLWTELDELTDFPHHRRYTRATLKKVLQKPGMKVSLCSYYNFFLFPLIVLTKLLKTSAEKQLQLPHRFFNTIFYHIFAAERFFLGWLRFPCGGSLITVITKEQ